MGHPSILVVDDELLIRDLLYDYFSGQGWSISVTESGEEALDILKEKKIDLVLTDIRMPKMDGLALASEVRQAHPDIPVVVMTGYPSVETAVAALRTKVIDYVTKPFNIHQLYKLLKTALNTDRG
jgi:DNA-binding NtrC family response regulator